MRVISRINFIHPIPIGGEFESIGSFDRSKHGHAVAVSEEPGFIVLKLTKDQRRVPLSNVSYIHETDDGVPTPTSAKVGK